MTLDEILDLIAAVLLLLGGLLSLAAGVGLVRFPDALSRLHAATKPQVLGLVFVVAALAIASRSHDYAQTLFVARMRGERVPDGTAWAGCIPSKRGGTGNSWAACMGSA